jgi:hypothetical protein
MQPAEEPDGSNEGNGPRDAASPAPVSHGHDS